MNTNCHPWNSFKSTPTVPVLYVLIAISGFVSTACGAKVEVLKPGRVFIDLEPGSSVSRVCIEPLATNSYLQDVSGFSGDVRLKDIASFSAASQQDRVNLLDYKLPEQIVAMQHVVFMLCQAYAIAESKTERDKIQRSIDSWSTWVRDTYTKNIREQLEAIDVAAKARANEEKARAEFRASTFVTRQNLCDKVRNLGGEKALELSTRYCSADGTVQQNFTQYTTELSSSPREFFGIISGFQLGEVSIDPNHQELARKSLQDAFLAAGRYVAGQSTTIDQEDSATDNTSAGFPLVVEVRGYVDKNDFKGCKDSEAANARLARARACIALRDTQNFIESKVFPLVGKPLMFQVVFSNTLQPISLEKDWQNRRVDVSVVPSVPGAGQDIENAVKGCEIDIIAAQNHDLCQR